MADSIPSFYWQEGRLIVDRMRLKYLEGALTHVGSSHLEGTAYVSTDMTIGRDLKVKGNIEADTISVKQLITENGQSLENPYAFSANTASELEGKGLTFTDGNKTRYLSYKNGERLWSNLNIDLDANSKFMIDNTEVLTLSALGPTVSKSNLKELGRLKKLNVSGPVNFNDYAFFSENNRFGINTESPNAAIGIIENDVELIIGSNKPGTGVIGVNSSSNLEIVTDNIPRITISNSGEIVIGHPKYKNGVLKVYGKLEVENVSWIDNGDGRFIVERIRPKYIEGNVTHVGSYNLEGASRFNGDMSVKGTLTVDTLKVKNIETENTPTATTSNIYTANTISELIGKGLQFTDGLSTRYFVLKEGDRLWSNIHLDIAETSSYMINNQAVLTKDSLGNGIVKSNLTEVGTLNGLAVSGHTKLNSLETVSLDAAGLKVLVNKTNVTTLGTTNDRNLEIITNNVSRVDISASGNVTVNGDMTIKGRLEVNEIVSDTRVERTSPLEFKNTVDSSIYGKGIIWTGMGPNKQFVYSASPDRFWSTESIDLAAEKIFSIENSMVLSKTSLGDSVTRSKLTQVGELESLVVNGPAEFKSGFKTNALILDNFKIDNNGITTSDTFTITVNDEEEFKINSDGDLTIGNEQNTNRKLALYGQVSIGVKNTDPETQFTVAGNISFANKKFVVGTETPTSGQYKKGDICWNSDPKATDYVGWVCVMSGTPGQWLPFGVISAT